MVADAAQAMIYLCEKRIQRVPMAGMNKHHLFDEKRDHELSLVDDGSVNAETTKTYQMGHDQRGTSSSSNSPTHNTYEPSGDIEKELHRRFVQRIANKLQKSADDLLFHHLVLIAPARMIADMKTLWTPDFKKRIIAIIPKDLAKIPASALMTHLRPALADAHIA